MTFILKATVTHVRTVPASHCGTFSGLQVCVAAKWESTPGLTTILIFASQVMEGHEMQQKENEISGIICCCNKFKSEAAALAFQVLFFADAPRAPNVNSKVDAFWRSSMPVTAQLCHLLGSNFKKFEPFTSAM